MAPYPSRPERTRRSTGRARGLSLLLTVPLLAGVFGASAGPVGADELADAQARQSALSKQLAKQKADVAQINSLQAELTFQISTTKRELNGINADLATVRKNINAMVVKIEAVKQQYLGLVAQLELLDTQLARIQVSEMRKRWALTERKAVLAERLRLAYDTDRTSMLETFLSGSSFTDVLADVSYTIDVSEQDRALAQQIVEDQATLAAIHQTVLDTRATTDQLRAEVVEQKAKLDAQLKELKAAQKELKRLEAETAKALEIQKAAYRKVLANKRNLAAAIAATAQAKAALASRIHDLVAEQYQRGNIPSSFNGTLTWPMAGRVTQDFGCTGFAWEGPLGDCAHFHQGIDIVAPAGTPIRSSGKGTVVYCGWNYADGADPAWIVIIAHSQGLETWYAHMQPGCPAPAGSGVKSGTVIGHEGNTGHSTGAHLHWAVRYNDQFVNPRLFL